MTIKEIANTMSAAAARAMKGLREVSDEIMNASRPGVRLTARRRRAIQAWFILTPVNVRPGWGATKGTRHNEKAYRPSILRRFWPHVVLGARRGGPSPPLRSSPLRSSRLPSPRSSLNNAVGERALRVLPDIGDAF